MSVLLSCSIVDRNLNEGLLYGRSICNRGTNSKFVDDLWEFAGAKFYGFFLFCTMIVTVPIIRRVILVGAIKYNWVLYEILPMQMFVVITLFDYHGVTDIWIK